MQKLTINIDDEVYQGLQKHIGRGNIGRFLSDLARPYVVKHQLNQSYKAMAQDKTREKMAEEWCENLSSDVNEEEMH